MNPGLFGLILLVAGVGLVWNWRAKLRAGETRPHDAHRLPIVGAVDPTLFWGLAFCFSGIGALLAALA
jgi:hypothetical protein